MKLKLAFVAAAIAVGAATSAGATINGAYEIKVTSANPPGNLGYLQIAELVANAGSTDVALATNGATATASSIYGGVALPSYAIDGLYPSSYPNIFHSGGNGVGEYLDVTFAAPANLTSIAIYGRGDGFNARDNYNVTIFNSAGATLYSGNINSTSVVGTGTTLDLTSISAAPEPGVWMMLFAGVAMIGAALRFRRRTGSLAAA